MQQCNLIKFAYNLCSQSDWLKWIFEASMLIMCYYGNSTNDFKIYSGATFSMKQIASQILMNHFFFLHFRKNPSFHISQNFSQMNTTANAIHYKIFLEMDTFEGFRSYSKSGRVNISH